jgi:hypothetical protein
LTSRSQKPTRVIGLPAGFIDLDLCLMNKRMALARTVAD